MSTEMERRKHPRFRTQFHAGFATEQLAGEGIVLNFSKEGCLVQSDTSPKEAHDRLERFMETLKKDQGAAE